MIEFSKWYTPYCDIALQASDSYFMLGQWLDSSSLMLVSVKLQSSAYPMCTYFESAHVSPVPEL